MIPKILQNKDFRFVKLKKNEKVPFEANWQQKEYAFDDTSLLAWVEGGGNYGVIGGFGRLRMLDIDDPALVPGISEVFKTFSVRTGKGGMHFYFLSDYDKNHVIGGGKGELRCNLQFVVGPGCLHPNGTRYTIANDAPLLNITGEKLSALLKPFFDFKNTKIDYGKVLKGEIETGSRNDGYFRAACAMRFTGISRETTTHILQTSNEKNAAPLNRAELQQCINSAYSYKEQSLKIKKTKLNEEKPQISCIIDDKNKTIAEQVYDGVNSFFLVCNNENMSIARLNEYNNFEPLKTEEVYKKAVMLPSDAVDYGDETELDKIILNFIHAWLDIPVDMELFCLWNIKRSWLFEKFHTLNYLRALGDTGRGKTRFLDVLSALHYKSISTSGATTAAPIFRLITRWKGTLVLDEADLKTSDETADIVKIINQGYEKGKYVIRCDQNDANNIQFFDCYCPKIIATRKTFQDKAVESRCITTVMQGTNRTDLKFSLTDQFYADATKIRNMLLYYRFKNYFNIAEQTEVPEIMKKLEPRLQQICSSFVSLFSNNKTAWLTFEKYITAQQERLYLEKQESFEGAIALAVLALVEERGLFADICSKDIIEKAGLTDKRGNLMKPRAISSALRTLGFENTKITRTHEGIKRTIPLKKTHLDSLKKNYGLVTECNDCNDITESPKAVEEVVIVDNNKEIKKEELNNIIVTTVTSVTEKEHILFTNKPKEVILLPCHYCGLPESCCYDSKGRPVCVLCRDNPNLKLEVV